MTDDRPGGSAGPRPEPDDADQAAEAGHAAPAARAGQAHPSLPVSGSAGSSGGRRDVRIVVIEDHALVREGTAELLQRDAGLIVVGQAGSAEDALGSLAELLPDVILVDMELPGMNGIELARVVAERHPEVRVLILTAYDDYAYVIGALEAGVAGYLLKTATAGELGDAVRAAAGGALVLDKAISRRLTSRWRGAAGGQPALTARETDVLRLIAQGLSNKQIAGQLGLGLRTVESHVSNVLAKLGLASRTEAALYAVSHRVALPGHHRTPG